MICIATLARNALFLMFQCHKYAHFRVYLFSAKVFKGVEVDCKCAKRQKATQIHKFSNQDKCQTTGLTL